MKKYKVTVLVESTYLEDHSDPFEDLYLWAYKVKIKNNGTYCIARILIRLPGILATLR